MELGTVEVNGLDDRGVEGVLWTWDSGSGDISWLAIFTPMVAAKVHDMVRGEGGTLFFVPPEKIL